MPVNIRNGMVARIDIRPDARDTLPGAGSGNDALPKSVELTTADLVVLSVFLYGRPMHGYEVLRRLEESDVDDWARISRPQVYYSLRKLARSGHLLPVDDGEPAQGPERLVYKPSNKARAAMRSALRDEAWIAARPPSPFVTWAALALNADEATINRQIDRRENFLSSQIEKERQTLIALEEAGGADIDLARVLVDLTIKQFSAELEILGDLRKALIVNAARKRV